jgi:hypothetical protein
MVVILQRQRARKRRKALRRLKSFSQHKGRGDRGDVNIDIEIPPYILRNILDNGRKRKADNPSDCRCCKVHVLPLLTGRSRVVFDVPKREPPKIERRRCLPKQREATQNIVGVRAFSFSRLVSLLINSAIQSVTIESRYVTRAMDSPIQCGSNSSVTRHTTDRNYSTENKVTAKQITNIWVI